MASMAATGVPAKDAHLLPGAERIYSIDAFRGFTMVCMIAEGFGLLFFLNHPVLGGIAGQFRHAAWEGMTAWDLVQPFFMFIVGAVMPVSFARRWAAGESWGQSLRHVLRRCALLIGFGLLARSIQANRPVIDLINVLAQVSFTYLVTFLVLRKSLSFQAGTAFGLLALHWAIFQFAGAPGVEGPWVRNANIGWYLDNWILGKNWGGSYVTINCLSSAANTIAGAMAGAMLVSAMPAARKTRILALSGAACLAAGLALSPFIPIIKKIWTASFAIYSLGFTLLALLFFYWICDLMKQRAWAKVFVVVGSNSIFIYLFHEILNRWLTQTGLVFTGWAVAMWEPGGRMLNAWLVIAFKIWLCFWLYKRKIFFKL